MLAAVTFGELAALVRQRIDGGYSQTEKQEGRKRLLAVVEELAAATREDNALLLQERVWRIAEVRMSGIGGIGTLAPATLSLNPTTGVTVVRGPNGHGKTSLARGIDCGLRGDRDVPDEAAGALWTANLLTEGIGSATIELSLVSGPAQLAVQVSFTPAGPLTVDAILTDDAGTRPVDIGDSWRRALLAARACFSYGALQGRLIEGRDLQGYLEELLVLGPAWEQARGEITTRADRATQAKKAVDTARRAAVEEEKALAERFENDAREPARPAAVSWPQAKDAVDVDAWLRSTGLEGVEAPDAIRVSADHENRVAELDRQLREASESLASAEEALATPGIAAALHHIERIMAVDDLDGGTCPLCGTETDWRAHIRQVTSSVQDRRRAAEGVRAIVSELADWVGSALIPLLTAAVPGGPNNEVAAFRQATLIDGYHAHSRGHEMAQRLLAALAKDEYHDWLSQLRAISDAGAEWRAALSTVAQRFAVVLREHGTTAAEAGAWKKAEETLNELQVEFRQRRQDNVTEQMHAALRLMLPDADIELTEIRHPGGVKQQRSVQVGLTIGGREAQLGMLSSGQRNALLLTPLVILDDTGPFGFLVVDDPVHALDDMRVDLLAQELARISRRRQVIVLTHDPRLEEHLRARCWDMTVVELHRDPRTRTVRWTAHTTPWQALLEDASKICRTASSDGWAYPESLHSVVAGMCRAAVDGALRQAVITRSVQRGENVDQALESLGEEKETRKRIEHVVDLAGGPDRLPRLDQGRKDHLKFWNQGAHGQLPDGVDLDATIDAAVEACADLTAFDWSAE